MSKILYIEPYAGIAGDMFAGSIVGLLDNPDEYLKQINSLPISNEFEVKITKIVKAGITANKFDVILKEHCHEHEKKKDKEHLKVAQASLKEKEHENESNKEKEQHHVHHHHGRHLSEIIDIINGADKISKRSKKTAIDIFKNLAVAEAQIHGTVSDKVHFHEVGAIDAIVDICSAAVIIELLNVDKIISAPVSTGTGTVKSAHGVIPVPAPATELLLRDLPVNKTGIKSELTTPTGAAILKTLVTSWQTTVKGQVIKSNYSAGFKDLKEITNILRTSIIETETVTNEENFDEIAVIECNIDDYPGEHFTFIEKALFNAGALDYILIPGTMKKSRPGILLQVICAKGNLEKLAEIILSHTSTNGIRYRIEKKNKAEQENSKNINPIRKGWS